MVGADRRGQPYTGWRHGTITAELEHNWEGQHTDLLAALSKKASVPVGKWHLVTLCPECTLFSAVNAINQVKGAAHGKKAVTALNTTAASPARVALEMQWYNAAKKALETQLLSLEAHPHITFLLENPWGSELWNLPELTQIKARNPQWKLEHIDRCAYGRHEQKPTGILHNSAWAPKGRTANGRCAAGRCTGWRTPAGKTKHPGVTVQDTRGEREVNKGSKKRGRWEFTRDAAVNAIERELLEEFLQAMGR